MFPVKDTAATPAPAATSTPTKYTPRSMYGQHATSGGGASSFRNLDELDALLETETQQNKTKPWSKLDKTQKLQRLHAYAEKYSREQGLPVKEIKTLKNFFTQSIDQSKLIKTKEVNYNPDTMDIISIPSLHYNSETGVFVLKNTDPKHVSVLKSLTPKRAEFI